VAVLPERRACNKGNLDFPSDVSIINHSESSINIVHSSAKEGKAGGGRFLMHDHGTKFKSNRVVSGQSHS
jgi:hypothetical protein